MSLPETMKAIANCRKGDDITYGVREIPTPKISDPKDIIIKMEACPVNPSDVAWMLSTVRSAAGEPEKVQAGDAPGTVQAPANDHIRGMFKDRVMSTVGNEGCGTVVAAGDDEAAQALMGKRVAVCQGKAYAQYVKFTVGIPGALMMPLPDDASPLDGASVFVNPLTAVGFVQTLRLNGHEGGMIHTAAGSQLGRMLVKYCKRENVPLVNIVRSEKQVEALKALGAEYVVNSSTETFQHDLKEAIKATRATIAFDAIGGGEMAGIILNAIQQSLYEIPGEDINPSYGPSRFRQLFKYGGLDRASTTLPPALGVGNFSFGGWLNLAHYQKHGPEKLKEAFEAIAANLKTDFTTTYGKHLAMEDCASSPEQYLATLKSTTDEKYLVTPNGPIA